MPDWTRLATMLPSVVAGLKGSGAETAAFMEGYNRTSQMLKQQQLQQQSVDEAGRRTDLAASEQEYQHGQDAFKNKQGALDTLLNALPGLASTAAPTVTGTTSMETPIGSIGVPQIQGPESGVMAQLQSLAGLLDQPDLAPSLGPLVQPAITRAEAARQNQRRKAYADAIELADKRSGASSEEQVQAGTILTVPLPNGATERVPYAEALKVSGMPPVRATPKTGQSLEAQLAAAKTPEEQDRILRLMGRQKALPGPPSTATSATPSGLDVDPGAIADAIISGDQPPETTGLYRYGAAVRTALARKGYDLATAKQDWTATQRHFATLNGPQQTRIRQAAMTAVDSLDVIQDLANQWKGGSLPILNRAQLTLAKNGALGPKAQTIATQLEAQITDVASELANVYMGGNSPTDHALQLAGKNLNADWSQAQLSDAITLARKNLTIRLNSIKNTDAITASGSAGKDKPASGVTILKIEKVK